jgi:hypothetical protein
MKAVWSYWTKPSQCGRPTGWKTEWHHRLAWGLSVYAARRHYPSTCLVTDDEGARLLVDELRLPFAHVSTGLNALRDEDPDWWALGKVAAYREQEEPFVHVDTDVFLWKRFAERIEGADVFTQNPEPLGQAFNCYFPEDVEQAVRARGGWLPEELPAYRTIDERPAAACCGVFGGQRIDFIREYAERALRLATDPQNRAAWDGLGNLRLHMLIVEQYLLMAGLAFHRAQPASPFRDVEMRYVFEPGDAPWTRDNVVRTGFTHLASDAKRNPRAMRDLAARVRRDLPEYYARCRRLPHESGWQPVAA